jgi:hypothetical protein
VTEPIIARDDEVALDPQVVRIARRAVEMLDLQNAIDGIGPLLFQQIEDCETIASAAPDTDMMFITLAVPLANNLIHHAAAWHAVEQAGQWVRANWPNTVPSQDPVATLAALTLIHLVVEGSEHFADDPVKKEIWSHIRQRIAHFTQVPATT